MEVQGATKIVDLMRVPEEKRGLPWLLQSLQAAIELEHATLPPYLCGLWSIREQSGPAYDLIRSVVLQEMLHMGLACNLLTTIGGRPEINTPKFIPTYPGHLPGGVRPELFVYLQGLTKEYVSSVFMQIEAPACCGLTSHMGMFPSIGAFYDAVLKAYKQQALSGEVKITGFLQVVANLGGLNTVYPINTLQDVEDAITEIKEQGEGTIKSPFTHPEDFDNRDRRQVAHFYKFAEVYYGRRLQKTTDDQWSYSGEMIPFPESFPMARVPPGGYPDVSRDFDWMYTQMLTSLHNAWNESPDYLFEAIRLMGELREPARELMQRPLPNEPGNYGPSFLYVP